MKYVLFIALIVWIILVYSFFGNVQAQDKKIDAKPEHSMLPSALADLILIKGGSFRMGDVFGEGKEDEIPVHTVKVADFYLAPYEVTVGEFRAFVEETGYVTSAEAPQNTTRQQELFAEYPKATTLEQRLAITDEFLNYGGTFCFDTEHHRFRFEPEANWRKPGFKQSDSDPVVCLSWDDAINYCNWLSVKEGLPVAYDIEARTMLDENGEPTTDVTRVKGYRLPTEAEWEYAAREGGKDVRFGNGNNIATADEINFRADAGDYTYCVNGTYRKKTTPIGSFAASSLGLFDMSGNAWEWCGDGYAAYSNSETPQENPYVAEGRSRVIRGGRWGGDAREVRVFARDKYEAPNRCNNSGFRIARSK